MSPLSGSRRTRRGQGAHAPRSPGGDLIRPWPGQGRREGLARDRLGCARIVRPLLLQGRRELDGRGEAGTLAGPVERLGRQVGPLGDRGYRVARGVGGRVRDRFRGPEGERSGREGPQEFLQELAGGLGPVVGVLRERPEDDLLDLGGDHDRGVLQRERRRRGVEVVVDQARDRPGERPESGQELEEDHADRVQVAPRVDRGAARLLGAGVGGRAHEAFGLGVEVERPLVAFEDLGDPEIQDLELFLARGAALDEHHVGGLEVAVDDLQAVRHVEHVAELLQEAGGPVEGHRHARRDQLVEALAADVLHLDEGRLARHPRVVDEHGVGMGQPRHDPRLALEPGPRLGIEGDSRDDQLQRARDVELEVADQVDGPHPPLADLPLDAVPAEDDLARLGMADEPVRLLPGIPGRPRDRVLARRGRDRRVGRGRAAEGRGRQLGVRARRLPAPRRVGERPARLVLGSIIGMSRSLGHAIVPGGSRGSAHREPRREQAPSRPRS